MNSQSEFVGYLQSEFARLFHMIKPRGTTVSEGRLSSLARIQWGWLAGDTSADLGFCNTYCRAFLMHFALVLATRVQTIQYIIGNLAPVRGNANLAPWVRY